MTEFLTDTVVRTQYWSRLDDGRIQCDLCPRECRLRDGQQGLCFIRKNHDGQIVLTSYGRSSGFCVDPIEKKPLNHFLPGTPVFSFGTAGCNLACKFCQNWDISKSREMASLADNATPEAIAIAAKKLNVRSVAYTYNDPVIFHEYAIDVADACHEAGILNVAVSAGYVSPDPRAEFYARMDAVNIDFKSFQEQFYFNLTGSHLKHVLETLLYIRNETNVWLETSTLLIPGHNDSDEEIDQMTSWVVKHLGTDMPMHFSAFHPSFKMHNVPSTPKSTLLRAREIAMKNGVRYPYIGNMHDSVAGSSWCHHCGELIIGRSGYTINAWHISTDATTGKGKCNHCQESVPGIFENRPGSWGARRLPIRLNA